MKPPTTTSTKIVFKIISKYSTRVTSNRCVVTVLEWDLSGENLLVADTSGLVQIWGMKDHLLNDWISLGSATFPGEHILSAVFFHNGKKVRKTLETDPD